MYFYTTATNRIWIFLNINYNSIKNTKYLGISWTKDAHDLSSKNYNILLTEIRDDLNKWENILCSRISRLRLTIMIRLSILPKLTYNPTIIPIKIKEGFLKEIDKMILKFIWKYKEPRRAKTILITKYKLVRFTLSSLKTYYKVIKTVWCWCQHKQINQRNQTGYRNRFMNIGLTDFQ